MCGHVGLLTKTPTLKEKKAFAQLLLIDQLRGEHATGVASITTENKYRLYKRALPACDFIQLGLAKNVMEASSRIYMGHNRHATLGEKNDENSHPFLIGTTILAHNGTVTNHKTSLVGRPEVATKFATDSETITYAIQNHGDTGEVLESIEGAYALVWYDFDSKTINFARNDERPFYFAIGKGYHFYASEAEMLELCLTRNELTNFEIEELPVGNWVSLPLDDITTATPEVVKFTPKVKVYTSYGAARNTYSSKREWNSYYQCFQDEISDFQEGSGPYNGNKNIVPIRKAPITNIGGGNDNRIYEYKDIELGKVYAVIPTAPHADLDNFYIGHTLYSDLEVEFYVPPQYHPELDDNLDTDYSKACNVEMNKIMGTGTAKILKGGMQGGLVALNPKLINETCGLCINKFYDGMGVEKHDADGIYYHKHCLDAYEQDSKSQTVN